MKEAFQQRRFSVEQLQLVGVCNQIMEQYAAQGFDLSLRQLYYQLVTVNVLPNRVESYTMLGKLISDARMAGLVDFSQHQAHFVHGVTTR